MQLELHAFGATLAQADPRIAVRVFQPQMKQLESELKRVKARQEKKKKKEKEEKEEEEDQARRECGSKGSKA